MSDTDLGQMDASELMVIIRRVLNSSRADESPWSTYETCLLWGTRPYLDDHGLDAARLGRVRDYLLDHADAGVHEWPYEQAHSVVKHLRLIADS